jgi:hypothetical protein
METAKNINYFKHLLVKAYEDIQTCAFECTFRYHKQKKTMFLNTVRQQFSGA